MDTEMRLKLCTNKTSLWTQKFEFHVISMSQNIILLLIFFQEFKNVIIILSLWAIQKEVVGHIGP